MDGERGRLAPLTTSRDMSVTGGCPEKAEQRKSHPHMLRLQFRHLPIGSGANADLAAESRFPHTYIESLMRETPTVLCSIAVGDFAETIEDDAG
jgi:hypothetical protein